MYTMCVMSLMLSRMATVTMISDEEEFGDSYILDKENKKPINQPSVAYVDIPQNPQNMTKQPPRQLVQLHRPSLVTGIAGWKRILSVKTLTLSPMMLCPSSHRSYFSESLFQKKWSRLWQITETSTVFSTRDIHKHQYEGNGANDWHVSKDAIVQMAGVRMYCETDTWYSPVSDVMSRNRVQDP